MPSDLVPSNPASLTTPGKLKSSDHHEAEDPGRYSENWYRWYVLFMLTGLYTFNFVDRQLLVILQEPIKADMGLTDTQLGLLSGFAFAVIYVVVGIPIARFADKGNRRNIVTVALVVWSGMTAISGFAQNYLQLLLFLDN